MNSKPSLHNRLLSLVALGVALLSPPAFAQNFYVSTNGADDWSGTLAAPNAQKTDGPFATLAHARDQIRKLRAAGTLPRSRIEVILRSGIYRIDRAFHLTTEDSGTAQAPIVYRAFPNEIVRLIGGTVVSGFKLVTDPAILARLAQSARGKVQQADLRALGVSDYGNAGGGGLELFFNGQPMQLSRWPNDGFVRIVDVLGKTAVDVRGTKGCAEGLFTFEGDRPRRWSSEKDIWVHGYWFWDWADQRQKVKSIDLDKQSIELELPYHGYGYRKGQWFYAYNLLSEIDQPGEWYLDRQAGLLYFWPPDPVEAGEAIVSVVPTVVRMDDVSYVTLQGLIIEAVRATAVTMTGGTDNRIIGCTIRNTGGSAVNVSGGARHGIVGCDIYQCGAGGLALSGGDRKTLTAAGQYADNNHIHQYGRWQPMYSAGIGLHGVGNVATHNLIDNAPHQAISFSGNDHLIEFNEIHSVCFESNDAGAIYAGRDWTMRGTAIRHNYLHDITGFQGRGCVGVYLDDMFCGTEISGNVFCRVASAAFIGGGRDCAIENNVFVDCHPAIHVDARALGWAHYHADEWIKEGGEKQTLAGTRFKEPPYSEHYSTLPGILSDDPKAPKGNRIAHNICFGGKWDDIETKARPFIIFQDNLLNADPHFVNAGADDFRLENDSPAYQLGFKPIPIEKIGLYQDERRATWPVRHQVRPTTRTALPFLRD